MTFGPLFVGDCCFCPSSSSSSSSGCGCPGPDQILFCDPGTVAATYSLTNSGIVPCVCADHIVRWITPVFTGLDQTFCLQFASMGLDGVSWILGGVTATLYIYSDSSCSGDPGVQVIEMTWTLYRLHDRWRLSLSGLAPTSTGGVVVYAFDSQIVDGEGPVDCCVDLHFENQLTDCTFTGDPVPGGGPVIATGGSADVTSCCDLGEDFPALDDSDFESLGDVNFLLMKG